MSATRACTRCSFAWSGAVTRTTRTSVSGQTSPLRWNDTVIELYVTSTCTPRIP